LTLTLEQGANGQPRVVMTVPADLGEADLVYVYEPIAVPATPAP
jgi:hypothetical protein